MCVCIYNMRLQPISCIALQIKSFPTVDIYLCKKLYLNCLTHCQVHVYGFS